MVDRYERLQEIGKGSFGSVFKVRRKDDDKMFCWKELDYGRMQDRERQQLVSEVNALSKLKHPNIV
jgi:NIMA (never in mitosis gene a)-related kinase